MEQGSIFIGTLTNSSQIPFRSMSNKRVLGVGEMGVLRFFSKPRAPTDTENYFFAFSNNQYIIIHFTNFSLSHWLNANR